MTVTNRLKEEKNGKERGGERETGILDVGMRKRCVRKRRKIIIIIMIEKRGR